MDVTDDNNNTSNEKSYSLRPRAPSKRDKEDSDEESWKPLVLSRRKKQKTPPLSKYRRKTANARERSRMREINEAFEALRKSIPQLACTSYDANEKISKIMTLRLAMKYITALSNALEDTQYPLDFQTTLSLMETSRTSPAMDEVRRKPLNTSSPPLESSSSVESLSSFSLMNHASPLGLHERLSPLEGMNFYPTEEKPPNPFSTPLRTASSSIPGHREFPEEGRQLQSRLSCGDESLTYLPDKIATPPNPENHLQNSPSPFDTDYIDIPSTFVDFGELFIT